MELHASSDKDTPARMGRPTKHGTAMVPIQMRFPREMLDELDAIVEERMGAVERAGLIREAVLDLIRRERRTKGRTT